MKEKIAVLNLSSLCYTFCSQLKAQQQRERMLEERLQSLQMLSEKVHLQYLSFAKFTYFFVVISDKKIHVSTDEYKDD